MPMCAVYKCGNKTGYISNTSTGKRINFHRFPNRDRSPERFTTWAEFCKKRNFVPGRNSVICSSHFKLSDCNESQLLKMKLMPDEKLRGPNLKPGAIPTINSPHFTTTDERPSNSVGEKQEIIIDKKPKPSLMTTEEKPFLSAQFDNTDCSSKSIGNNNDSNWKYIRYEPGNEDSKDCVSWSPKWVSPTHDSNEDPLAPRECNLSADDHTANCKEKWKNLRACLCRHLRTQVSSSWKRPYYLADYMKFVIPFTKYGRPSDELSTTQCFTSMSDNETEETDESCIDALYIKQEMDEDSIEISVDNPLPVPVVDYGAEADAISSAGEQTNYDECSETNIVSGSHDAQPRLKIKRTLQKIEPLEKVKVEYLTEKKQKLFMSSSYNSPDLEFFKSLLPDLDRMNYRQKIKFKLAVLGCIENILYAETGEENNGDS